MPQVNQLPGRVSATPVARHGRGGQPASVVIPAATYDALIQRLSRLYYSPRDPEQFSHDKLDLVREMRGWQR